MPEINDLFAQYPLFFFAVGIVSVVFLLLMAFEQEARIIPDPQDSGASLNKKCDQNNDAAEEDDGSDDTDIVGTVQEVSSFKNQTGEILLVTMTLQGEEYENSVFLFFDYDEESMRDLSLATKGQRIGITQLEPCGDYVHTVDEYVLLDG